MKHRLVPYLAVLSLTLGCTHERVRVLDVETDQPVAGAEVVPLINDLFGTPGAAGHEITDDDGCAKIVRVGERHGYRVYYKGMEQARLHGKPSNADGVKLLYLRRPDHD